MINISIQLGKVDMPTRIMVIPDVQLRSEDDITFLNYIGRYAVEMKPDVIVQLGDFADMPSLSTHDKPGSRGMEGLRYKKDIQTVHRGMEVLLDPIRKFQESAIKQKRKRWNPRLILTLGNHEDRINRAIYNDPKLDGLISIDDLKYEEYGWEVVPFLKPITVEGIVFCHYMVSGVMGRPVTTARALLTKFHQSTIVGHQQGRDISYGHKADGNEITSLIIGSCYEHDEGYMNPQTNNHWRGLYILNDVVDGSFDEMPISLRYLKRKYQGKK